VILGHSERRQYQKESDELISKKALAVHAASLKPIVCVGETLSEREGGQTEKVLETQVRGSLGALTKEQMVETIVAYEPVWAIGTGKTASTSQAQDAHHRPRMPTRSYEVYWVKCSMKLLPAASEFNMVAESNLPMRES